MPQTEIKLPLCRLTLSLIPTLTFVLNISSFLIVPTNDYLTWNTRNTYKNIISRIRLFRPFFLLQCGYVARKYSLLNFLSLVRPSFDYFFNFIFVYPSYPQLTMLLPSSTRRFLLSEYARVVENLRTDRIWILIFGFGWTQFIIVFLFDFFSFGEVLTDSDFNNEPSATGFTCYRNFDTYTYIYYLYMRVCVCVNIWNITDNRATVLRVSSSVSLLISHCSRTNFVSQELCPSQNSIRLVYLEKITNFK